MQNENAVLRTENENLRQGVLIVYKALKGIYPYNLLRTDELISILEKIAYYQSETAPDDMGLSA